MRNCVQSGYKRGVPKVTAGGEKEGGTGWVGEGGGWTQASRETSCRGECRKRRRVGGWAGLEEHGRRRGCSGADLRERLARREVVFLERTERLYALRCIALNCAMAHGRLGREVAQRSSYFV